MLMETTRSQAFRSGRRAASTSSPPLIPHQLATRPPHSSYTPKGLAFHHDLLGTGSTQAARLFPLLAHYSIARYHCLPETIPGSSQVSRLLGCPLQPCLTSPVPVWQLPTRPSVSPNQRVSSLRTGMVLRVYPAGVSSSG